MLSSTRSQGQGLCIERAPAPNESDAVLGLGRRSLFFRRFLAVGSAATLALARVLAFAAVVPGLTAALTLARVLALTGMLFLDLLVVLLVLALVLIRSAEGSLQ